MNWKQEDLRYGKSIKNIRRQEYMLEIERVADDTGLRWLPVSLLLDFQ